MVSIVAPSKPSSIIASPRPPSVVSLDTTAQALMPKSMIENLEDALYDENLGEPIGQVLVICGRNRKLANRLSSIDWKVPLQEEGNMPYVVENGCGKFSKSPKEIANIVSQWFGPKIDELQAMSQNCIKLARPDFVFKIVNDLHELARQRTLVPQYSCAT